MRKCVVIPDSFKGSVSSMDICSIVKEQIEQIFPQCEVVCIPVGDGGEGTLECFHAALGGEMRDCLASGPFFEERIARYLLLPDRNTAVLEVAQCVGLPLVQGRQEPGLATTFGVGRMILAALKSGVRKIIIGLGGSCTNDGGLGMAAALGARFFDAENREFIPTGDSISRIGRMDVGRMAPELNGVEVVAMCDVNNPLWGENGASMVFGPQKGADEAHAQQLDRNLRFLDQLLARDLKKAVGHVPGSGAAGGLGAAILAFLGGSLKSGIETVLDTVRFDEIVQDADLVITGEGKLDSQSLNGKVIQGVTQHAQKWNVPVVALVGMLEDGIDALYQNGLTAAFTVGTRACPLEEAMQRAKHDLAVTTRNLCGFLKCRDVERQASSSDDCRRQETGEYADAEPGKRH